MRKRFALCLCLSFIFCVGCGPQQNADNPASTGSHPSTAPEQIFGASLSGEDGGQIFKQSSVSLPELGLYAQMAVPLSKDEIAILCKKGADENRFFSLDIPTQSVQPLALNMEGEIVDMDSMGDGVLTLLSVNREGNYVLSTVSPDLSVRELLLPASSEGAALWNVCACENGFLLDQSGTVVALDKNGEQVTSYGPYRGKVSFAHSPGREPLILSQVTDEVGAKIQVLDSAFQIKETVDLKNSYSEFYDGKENGLFAHSSGLIYRIDYQKDTRTGYCNESASGGGTVNFIYLSDDCFFSIQKGVPTLWSPSDAEGVTVLTLATYGMNLDLSAALDGFNELSDAYQIDVVDYAVYDEAGHAGLGLTRLSTDIISGDTPDIYSLNGLPARMFAHRGLLQDLRPLIDSDPALSYDDLIPSVARAMEDRGKMVYLVPSFYLYTMYGDSEIVGDQVDWSVDDFLALSDEYSAQELLGSEVTKNDFLRNVLIFNSEQYLDYEKGTCAFSDPGFIRLLSFAAGLPDEPLASDSSKWAKAYCGEQVLISENFQDVISSIATADGVFHGNTSYVGFPTDHKTGIKMSPVIWLAMSSTAVSQEGVWEFFSYLLSDEFQNRTYQEGITTAGSLLMQGMPSVQKNFELRSDLWIETLSKWNFCLTTILNGSAYDIPAATADARTCLTATSLANRVSGLYELDSNVYTIVIEEAAAFFNGYKTAEEAANMIQSRAELYMAEQYS